MELEIHHSPEALKAVYRELFRQRFWVAQVVAFVAAVGSLLAMMLLRSAPWYLVVVCTLAVVTAALISTSRDTAAALALEQLEKMGPAGLRYTLGPDSLEEVSAVARAALPWAAFDGWSECAGYLVLWRVPKSSYAFVALPLEQLTPAAREQLTRLVRPR